MLMFKRMMLVFAMIAAGANAWGHGVALLPVAEDTCMVQGLSALGSSANRNFISNAGVVRTPGGVVVIDALGSPDVAEQLLREIQRTTGQGVSDVVITHYHADHIYGLQVFRAAGARIWAHREARAYLLSDAAALRLAASRQELAPWINADTHLVGADVWIDGPTVMRVGGVQLELHPVGPAHSPEDLVVWVPQRGVLFAGDLVFRGRLPFVGQADSARWVQSLDRLIDYNARVIVPGHGPMSSHTQDDLRLTRDYLVHLRTTMGEAARQMEPFEQAYARTDWSRFERLPLFGAANRMNAYNTYLLMEQLHK